MEIQFEDRHLLYDSLVKELLLSKQGETYSQKAMGNYSITFFAKEFLIMYSCDRSQLTVNIASNYAPDDWYYSLILKNFIMGSDKLNIADPNDFSLKSVLSANNFIKENFDRISELLSQKNYKKTRSQIIAKLKEESKTNSTAGHA